MKYLLLIPLLIGSYTVNAAIPKSQPLQHPQNILRGQGALAGGTAGAGFSLLNLRTSKSVVKKTERLVIDVGDAGLQKLKGPVGYFNVELKNNRQLVIDFAQTMNTKFKENNISKVFKGSLYIKNSELRFDPLTQNMSLVLDLKKPAAVRVVSVQGGKQTGKVILDFFEDRKK